jgi:DNA polymerase elongation subunit (family B)
MGLHIDGIGEKAFGTTFESNILFPLRFMIDVGMVGMSWVEIPAGQYQVVDDRDKVSTAQIEVHFTYDAIIAHAPDGEWMKTAPLRILSMGTLLSPTPPPATRSSATYQSHTSVQILSALLVKMLSRRQIRIR